MSNSSDYIITTVSSSVGQYGADSQAPFRVGPYGAMSLRSPCRPYYSSKNSNLYRVEDCSAGYVDSYAIFDGIPAFDWVTYQNEDVGLYPSTKYTLSSWIYQETLDPGVVFSHRAGEGASDPYIRWSIISDEVRFDHANGASVTFYTTNTSPFATLNQWHNVAITFDAGNVEIYVNGVAQTKGGSNLNTAAPSPPAPIFTTINGNPSFATQTSGRFKEFAYWVGVTASAAQVLEIYNNGIPPDLSSLPTLTSPIFWAPMNGTWDLSIGVGTPLVSGSPSFGP